MADPVGPLFFERLSMSLAITSFRSEAGVGESARGVFAGAVVKRNVICKVGGCGRVWL